MTTLLRAIVGAALAAARPVTAPRPARAAAPGAPILPAQWMGRVHGPRVTLTASGGGAPCGIDGASRGASRRTPDGSRPSCRQRAKANVVRRANALGVPAALDTRSTTQICTEAR